MTFEEIVAKAHKSGDYQPLVDAVPYAKFVGLEFQRFGNDVIFKLPKSPKIIGNPLLPAIHGGVIGGFMEMSAMLHLMMFLDTPAMPKIVDFSLDYLRAGRDRDTFAECHLTRQGSRVANVVINAWQTRRQDSIATARAHFLLAQ